MTDVVRQGRVIQVNAGKENGNGCECNSEAVGRLNQVSDMI
jgi:hypothetical protein